MAEAMESGLRPVSVIVVTYNSGDVIAACLASIPDGCETIIVDNGSSDADEIDRIGQPHHARVLRLADNRGFGAACNLGAAQASRPLLLFLNPDARLADGALDYLARAAKLHGDDVAFAPRIIDGKGRQSFKGRSLLVPRSEWVRALPRTDQAVPVLAGSAFMVRASAFRGVGGFDEDIFMYHEDDDLSLRLKREAGGLFYIHEAVVYHTGGGSSRANLETTRIKAFAMGRSRVYALAKHRRPFPRLQPFGSALLQLLNPVVLLSARKRTKQMAFLRGVLDGARAIKGH